MPNYPMVCDTCGAKQLIYCKIHEYGEGIFPVCVCGVKMRRDWERAGKITHKSKGLFGFVTKNMGDGPQYVHDYNDLQQKLKARGLHLAEPDREMDYYAKHMRETYPKPEGG